MHFAYADESGDSGDVDSGGSSTFSLGCLLVPGEKWPTIFDDVIDFRRSLLRSFGIPVRAEIKANYLLRNGGPLRVRPLSERARFAVYRSHMRLVPKIECLAFAVVVDKRQMKALGRTDDPRDVAWEYLLQRLERFTTRTPTHVCLVHDEGHADRIRALARKARRAGTAGSAFGTGSLSRPARRLLDDPVPRKSHESYMVQIADLLAFAAFRRLHPPPPTGRPQVVPQHMWDELGSGAFGAVNRLAGGPPGIVLWPK